MTTRILAALLLAAALTGCGGGNAKEKQQNAGPPTYTPTKLPPGTQTGPPAVPADRGKAKPSVPPRLTPPK